MSLSLPELNQKIQNAIAYATVDFQLKNQHVNGIVDLVNFLIPPPGGFQVTKEAILAFLPFIDAVSKAYTAFNQRQCQDEVTLSFTAQVSCYLLFAYAHMLDYAFSDISFLDPSKWSAKDYERFFAPCAFLIDFGRDEPSINRLLGYLDVVRLNLEMKPAFEHTMYKYFYSMRCLLIVAREIPDLPGGDSSPTIRTLRSKNLVENKLYSMLHLAVGIMEKSINGQIIPMIDVALREFTVCLGLSYLKAIKFDSVVSPEHLATILPYLSSRLHEFLRKTPIENVADLLGAIELSCWLVSKALAFGRDPDKDWELMEYIADNDGVSSLRQGYDTLKGFLPDNEVDKENILCITSAKLSVISLRVLMLCKRGSDDNSIAALNEIPDMIVDYLRLRDNADINDTSKYSDDVNFNSLPEFSPVSSFFLSFSFLPGALQELPTDTPLKFVVLTTRWLQILASTFPASLSGPSPVVTLWIWAAQNTVKLLHLLTIVIHSGVENRVQASDPRNFPWEMMVDLCQASLKLQMLYGELGDADFVKILKSNLEAPIILPKFQGMLLNQFQILIGALSSRLTRQIVKIRTEGDDTTADEAMLALPGLILKMFYAIDTLPRGWHTTYLDTNNAVLVPSVGVAIAPWWENLKYTLLGTEPSLASLSSIWQEHLAPVLPDKEHQFRELRLMAAARSVIPGQDRAMERAKALGKLDCAWLGCTTLSKRVSDKLKRSRCSACLQVHYCCAACQKADWKGHKVACKIFKEKLNR